MYLYGFCQNVWLLTRIPLNSKNIYIHTIYQCIAINFSCCFLYEFHLCYYYPPLEDLIFGS